MVDAQIDPVGIFALKIFTEELCVGDINCGDDFARIENLSMPSNMKAKSFGILSPHSTDPLALGNERPCRRRCAERVAVRMRVARRIYTSLSSKTFAVSFRSILIIDSPYPVAIGSVISFLFREFVYHAGYAHAFFNGVIGDKLSSGVLRLQPLAEVSRRI